MQITCHGLKEEDFQVEFTDHTILIGRDDTSGIAILEEGVSRCHAILTEEGKDLFIQDNDSLNGVFLNYSQIRDRRKLSDGDIIQIGFRLIKVFLDADQGAVFDFIPPELTEFMSKDPVDMPMKSSATGKTHPAGDVIERTVVMSESQYSRQVSSRKPFSAGSEIGKYIILKRIGKGGMGEVYLAKHATLGVFRALKVLSADITDDNERFLDRFIREAKLAAEIRHPNVVGVMDVETDPVCGIPYIVMEYIDGGSLRNSLSICRKLSEEQAVVIVEAVASALQAAKEHNIVHRDIKPDNIMFTERGEVKLADLGIAKRSDRDNSLTKSNMMIGTPAYLPPEQAQNAKDVDARADIYSLGATFYEMLTGEPPYPGETTIEILHKLFSDPVPDPRKINRKISPASAAIVMKMMAKKPKDRYQSAEALLNVMEETFPSHSAHESAQLIKDVIAGKCEDNPSFDAGIDLTHFPAPRKGAFTFGLFFGCIVLFILYLIFGKPVRALLFYDPDTGTGKKTLENILPSFKKHYELRLKASPDSEIALTLPDGRTMKYSSGPQGQLILPGMDTGKYIATVSRKNSIHSTTKEFNLYDNMTLELPLKSDSSGDPLIVTTNLDIVDPDDDVNSLREALGYAMAHGTNKTVSFAGDYRINLSSPLPVSGSITLDGGKNRITITGPKTKPMFLVTKSNVSLTLKYLTLLSDYSGSDAGILNVSSGPNPYHFEWFWENGISRNDIGLVELVSVKDGGKAKTLWSISGFGISLKGTSHLHRLSGINGATVRVGIDSILESSSLSGIKDRVDGDIMVYGTLKDSSVSNHGDIYVFKGGKCENLTVKRNGFVENRQGGEINGLKLEFGAVYGYANNGPADGNQPRLRGKVTLGGVTKAPLPSVSTTVNGETDIVFDLTERSAQSSFSFSHKTKLQAYTVRKSTHPHPIIDNMASFGKAFSYTVMVKEDQLPGTYILADNAANFNTPVSLLIGNTVKMISVGTRYTIKNKVYSLLLVKEDKMASTGTSGSVLVLTISNR